MYMCSTISCKKNAIQSNNTDINFSTDTLLFDTVFVSLGSATYQVKLYNNQSKMVKISSIRLASGNKSMFRLNIKGVAGNELTNQELAPYDSLYIYSTVTIDPNAALAPFVVEDKLIATVNNKEFSIPVIAYGQNARYVYDSVLSTQTWDNKLPYVIINNALVDKDQTLTIQPGCRVYVHPNSRLYVDGTLSAEGTKQDSIVFQSDRIDRSYFPSGGLPGEWGGIYFTENSKYNKLKWVVLKNGGASTRIGNNSTQAAVIQVDKNSSISVPSEGVQLDNCIIQNAFAYGIFCYGGKMQIRNSLINACGAQNIAAFLGGDIDIAQCTFVNYGTKWVNHSEAPVISLLNYLDTSQTGYLQGDLKVLIHNSIIYGSLEEEFISNNKGAGVFDVQLSNCLIKTTKINALTNVVGCKFNEDPIFESADKWDYRLKDSSPAKGAGAAPFWGTNLDDISGLGNIGAY